MKQIGALVRLARPRQWVKNIFVLTALLFSGRILEAGSWLQIGLAVAAFCLASSSIYHLNDYQDIAEDRRHPKKKNRPLASGILPPWVGPLGFLVAGLGSLTLAWFGLNPLTTLVVASYLVVNLSYSLWFKHVVVVDVLLIAAGFVLRILAGATAIGVMPSTWLLVCGVTISLFLGFTKRRAEVVSLGDSAASHRRVLADYSTPFLDQIISIVTASTLVCYILYTVDDRTVALVGSPLMLLTVPLVIYGIFRYLFLIYQEHQGGDPTSTVFTDRPMLVTGSLWAVLCGVLIVWGQKVTAFIFLFGASAP